MADGWKSETRVRVRVAAALFVATSLPMINLSCRPRFGVTGIQTAGACGDFLFSGHASIVAASICLFWAQRWAGAPRWPLALLVPLTVLLVVVSFGYAFERWHYTIDVALGFLVTCANPSHPHFPAAPAPPAPRSPPPPSTPHRRVPPAASPPGSASPSI